MAGRSGEPSTDLRARRLPSSRLRHRSRVPDSASPPNEPVYRFPVAPVLRAVRADADLSQRELAAAAGLRHSTLGGIESGAHLDPRLSTLVRLLTAAGCELLVLDRDGQPLELWAYERARDRGGRHFPAHRRVRPLRSPWDWWGAVRYSTWARPPTPLFTYDLREPPVR